MWLDWVHVDWIDKKLLIAEKIIKVVMTVFDGKHGRLSPENIDMLANNAAKELERLKQIRMNIDTLYNEDGSFNSESNSITGISRFVALAMLQFHWSSNNLNTISQDDQRKIILSISHDMKNHIEKYIVETPSSS